MAVNTIIDGANASLIATGGASATDANATGKGGNVFVFGGNAGLARGTSGADGGSLYIAAGKGTGAGIDGTIFLGTNGSLFFNNIQMSGAGKQTTILGKLEVIEETILAKKVFAKNDIDVRGSLKTDGDIFLGASATSINIGNTSFTYNIDRKGRTYYSGTTPNAGNFLLSSGWGTTASMGSISGNDSALMFTVASNGISQAANPTIVYTFQGGIMPNPPVAVIRLSTASAITDVGTSLAWTATPTTITITFLGTPLDTRTYTFSMLMQGVA